MDIPAGDPDYVVTDTFEVPVDVDALSIYPHAHYTGKSMDAWAVLPDGVETPLLRIPAWDFDWQDEYWFAQPVPLPAGTSLHLRYVYDNSAANPRNPFSPPRRGRWGPRSTDVMGDYWLQVVARNAADEPALRRALGEKDLRIAIDGYRLRLRDDPRNAEALGRLGRIHSTLGEIEPALAYLRRALAVDSRSWLLHFETGLALAGARRHEEAVGEFRAALEIDPSIVEVNNNLAAASLAIGRTDQAREALEAADRLQPDSAEIKTNLAVVFEREGQLDRALALYGEALRLDPSHAEAHGNLGTLLVRLGRVDDAELQLREALRLRPVYPAALKNLANVLAQSGRETEAMDTLREAIRADPSDPDARFLLALGLAEAGDSAAAREQVGAALQLRPDFEEAKRLLSELGG
jgi:tetratricopeptide (TPR) repeat protein